MPASIFADEWRECLRAHYSYVIRADDRLTERTLRGVMMHEAGFTEAELKELQVRATMRVEDAPDLVPDLDILQEDSAPHSIAVAMPQEVIHALVVEDALERDEQAEALANADRAGEADLLDTAAEVLLDGDDASDALLMDEMAALDAADLLDDDAESDEPLLDEMPVVEDAPLLDDDAESDEPPEDEPPPHDPEGAQQLSLF